MSTFAEKQEQWELRSTEDGNKRHLWRTRATLAELRKSGGLGLTEQDYDSDGPRVVVRRSIEDTTWRRVSGSGAKAVFERVL